MSGILEEGAKGLAESLCLDILAGIAAGDYPPDSALPTETRLASDYGVSRSMVRLALEQLKKRGVVYSEQGSGTFVRHVDQSALAALRPSSKFDEHRYCYTCRLAIEPVVASELATQRPVAALRYLEDEIERLERRRAAEADSEGFKTASDASFHIQLAEFSGNPFFHAIMVRMRPHIVIGMNNEKTLSESERRVHAACNIAEHRAVIREILDGDAEAAHRAMSMHITNGRRRVTRQEAV